MRHPADYYMNKLARNTLIMWYIDCMDDQQQSIDEINEAEQYLQGLNNYQLIEECTRYMPGCIEDLKRSLDDYNSYSIDLDKYRAMESPMLPQFA
jgi:hypothetical protein